MYAGYVESRWRNYCCPRKVIRIIYSFSVYVVLATQRAQRMRRNVLSSVASPAVLYFCTLSYKRYDFRKKIF